MLHRKRVFTKLCALPVGSRHMSSSVSEASFKKKSFRGFYHPAESSSSVSSLILAEQTALQEHRSTTSLGPESRQPVDVMPRKHIITQENQHTMLTELITPLWKMPYKEQLNVKFLKSVEFLKSFKRKMEKCSVDLDSNQYGLPCDLYQSVPSPKWRWYKNKDEFIVHVGVDRFTPTVGFCLGNAKELQGTVCIAPSQLTNIKPEHKQVAQLFQDYLQQSVLPLTEDLSRNHWRKLLVRSNHQNQLLISATMHPQNLTQLEIDQEKQKFVRYFTEGPGCEIELKNIFFQSWDRENMSSHELLWGDPYLEEVQADLKLRICPLTALLENSTVSDNFFEVLKEAADLKPGSTLLDVNCGAGAVGLHLARLTNRVIGIKRTAGKVENVYYNAESNGISNVNFTQRAPIAVLKQLKQTYLTDLVAIINPSEHFLSRDCIFQLKAVKSLRRVVYITDQLDGRAKQNMVLMCQPSPYDLECPQFVPLKATPVDIFPQTNSYYFVIVFERH